MPGAAFSNVRAVSVRAAAAVPLMEVVAIVVLLGSRSVLACAPAG
jgi:hypothetical protein